MQVSGSLIVVYLVLAALMVTISNKSTGHFHVGKRGKKREGGKGKMAGKPSGGKHGVFPLLVLS